LAATPPFRYDGGSENRRVKRMNRSLSRRFAAIALFAVLLAALAPTLSYLVAAAKGERAVEMCTSFGLQKSGGAPTGGLADGGHCPFCLVADAPLPFPAAPVAAFPPPVAAQPMPGRHHAAPPPDPLLAWFSSRQHAPPAFS
jgi:hypothetical protein